MNDKSDNIKKERLSSKMKVAISTYELAAGNATIACKKANISRQTFYEWKKTNSKFSMAIQDIDEEQLDFAESMLLKNIRSKKEASIFFFLKTKGRERGYIEKSEVEHSGQISLIDIIMEATAQDG